MKLIIRVTVCNFLGEFSIVQNNVLLFPSRIMKPSKPRHEMNFDSKPNPNRVVSVRYKIITIE